MRGTFHPLSLGFWFIAFFCVGTFYVQHLIHINTPNEEHVIEVPLSGPLRKQHLHTDMNESSKISQIHHIDSKMHDMNPSKIVKSMEENSLDSWFDSTIQLKVNQASTIQSKFNETNNKMPDDTNRKIHAVTYASHQGSDDRFCRAVESAVRHDIKLTILGWGVKWEGLSQKLLASHSYAKSLPPTDIILFTDAFDVLFTNKVDQIYENFIALSSETDSKIIFSAECGCWPHVMEDRAVCFTGYPKSPTPYRYLNSGTWIGYADSSVIMLEQIIKEAGTNFKNANDQKLVADMYINDRYGIKLDFYNKIFQSMHMTLDAPLPMCNPVDDIALLNSKWVNKRTKGLPSVLHFNGGGKRYHLNMESRMWYKNKEYNTKEMKDKLGSFLLIVPTAKNGVLRFDQLCRDYFRNMKKYP